VILSAKYLPPTTAKVVHKQCPKKDPMKTMTALLLAAKAIVEICDLSPHSPKKVNVKACQNTSFVEILKVFKGLPLDGADSMSASLRVSFPVSGS